MTSLYMDDSSNDQVLPTATLGSSSPYDELDSLLHGSGSMLGDGTICPSQLGGGDAKLNSGVDQKLMFENYITGGGYSDESSSFMSSGSVPLATLSDNTTSNSGNIGNNSNNGNNSGNNSGTVRRSSRSRKSSAVAKRNMEQQQQQQQHDEFPVPSTVPASPPSLGSTPSVSPATVVRSLAVAGVADTSDIVDVKLVTTKDVEEEEAKKARNRESAKESRQKKKAYMKNLEAQCATLTKAEAQLKSRVNQLSAENSDLRNQIDNLKRTLHNAPVLGALIQSVNLNARTINANKRKRADSALSAGEGEDATGDNEPTGAGSICVNVSSDCVLTICSCHHCSQSAATLAGSGGSSGDSGVESTDSVPPPAKRARHK